MISGFSSASFATALRSAGQARATTETVTRQIATGQKVASVKDDGAAWTRAANLKSEKAQAAGREITIARLDAALAFTGAANERTIAALERLQELVLAARTTVAGSSQRALLQNEWNQVTEWTRVTQVNEPVATLPGIQDLGFDIGYNLGGTDSFFGGALWSVEAGSWSDVYMTSAGGAWPITPPRGFNLLTAGTAQLDDINNSLNIYLGDTRSRWPVVVGSDQRRLDSLKDLNQATVNRLDRAIGALTDVDMGKASSELRESQTRQQLALSTVRQAISTYGAFASGLLGNAQRTQRGVLA